MQKVLLISTHFPPLSTTGTRRPARIAKHLPKYGWKPVVLTIRPDDPFMTYLGHAKYDRSMNLPASDSVAVYRTRTLDIYAPFMALKSLKRRLSKSSPAGKNEPSNVGGNSTATSSGLEMAIKGFMAKYIAFPDAAVTWLPFALWKGYQILREHKIDLLYSTSPYNATHLIAMLLKSLTQTPWVAEFRDPWMYQYLYGESVPRPQFLRRLDRWLEGAVIRSADCTLNATETMTAEMATQYPRQKSKLETLMNGYDREDYATGDETVERFTKFTIVYTGVFISDYINAPVALFQALRQLIDTGKIPESNIQLLILGRRHPDIRRLIADFQLSKVVIEKDHLPRKVAIQHQQGADVLLLVTSTLKLVVTTKVFEYLAAHKPILALSYPGVEANQIIKRANGGIIVPAEDPEAIADALSELYRQHQRGGIYYQPDINVIEEYEAGNLTRRLGQLFDRIVQGGR
jgi:glycosyltransferase involved in cell wall biosynthesis